MREVIFCFFLISSITASGFVTQTVNVPAKIKEQFYQTFEMTSDVKWFSKGDQITVDFLNNEIRTLVTYDKRGKILQAQRYLKESDLPLNILIKIREKYKTMKVGIISELLEEGLITYSINLEDLQNICVVECDSYANLKLHLKFRKQ